MVISVLVVALVYSSSYTFSVFAVPPDNRWGGTGECDAGGPVAEATQVTTCCWFEKPEGGAAGPEVKYCQACVRQQGGGLDCDPKYVPTMVLLPVAGETVAPPQDGVLEQPPSQTPRTPGQGGLPQDGVLEQPPTQGVAPPTRGQGVLPQDEGVLQQPTDEGAAPRIVEPPPPTCAPGSVLDPDINECVLENPPELCPDGSIPQPTGPGGRQPECPSSEAEQPGAGPLAEEEQEESALEEEQQQSEEGDDSSSSEDDSDNNDN